MAAMKEIEVKALKLSAARDALAGAHTTCEEAVAVLRKEWRKEILKRTADFKVAAEDLQKLVAESATQFVKPRSVIMHGIKVGFQKGKGKLEWEDDEQVCKLIRKHQPDLVTVLIKIEETPVKGALNELSAADLRKLGIVVEETGDVPFVKLADTEIAKMVKALLKDKGDEA